MNKFTPKNERRLIDDNLPIYLKHVKDNTLFGFIICIESGCRYAFIRDGVMQKGFDNYSSIEECINDLKKTWNFYYIDVNIQEI
jgi:hypothetical protein